MHGLSLTIYPSDQKSFGPCECCGEMTSRVWGYVDDPEATVATYFVEWTPEHEGRSANFDLIVGEWGEDTDSSQRQAVALEFRKFETGPAFMVIDAASRPVAQSSLVGGALTRDAIVGQPIAAQIFAICDTIYTEDPRIDELRA